MAVDCTFADDAFLIAAFPSVVTMSPERYVVAVVAALPGDYVVTSNSAGFPYTAGAEDDPTDIRNGLLAILGLQVGFAVAPSGANALLLEASEGGLGLSVTGPGANTIEATLIAGGDVNAASRVFWLERAKCWLPPCCLVTCASDYTMMHAAVAAHYIDKFAGGASTGSATMGKFKAMRLGPASLEAAAKAWSTANPADADMDDGGPGSLYLSIRARYVFGFRCA